MMSSITKKPMNLNKGRAGCHYAASPLTRQYFLMPNIMLMTPETAETKIQAPSAMTVPTKSKSLPKLNVAMLVTCVNLQDTDAAIQDQMVTSNTVKPRSRSFLMSSIITLNDMDLDVAKSRTSYYASNRLISLFFHAKHYVDDTRTSNPSAVSHD